MPSVWEVGQCMSPHLYLESQLMRPMARVETGLGSHPALRSPLQSQQKGILKLLMLCRFWAMNTDFFHWNDWMIGE